MSAEGLWPLLGLLSVMPFVRKAALVHRPKPHWRERFLDPDKLSQRWPASVTSARTRVGAGRRAIYLMDREGDSYELLAAMATHGDRFVVRLHDDRRVAPDGEVPAAGQLREALPPTSARIEREVALSASRRSSGGSSPRNRSRPPSRSCKWWTGTAPGGSSKSSSSASKPAVPTRSGTLRALTPSSSPSRYSHPLPGNCYCCGTWRARCTTPPRASCSPGDSSKSCGPRPGAPDCRRSRRPETDCLRSHASGATFGRMANPGGSCSGAVCRSCSAWKPAGRPLSRPEDVIHHEGGGRTPPVCAPRLAPRPQSTGRPAIVAEAATGRADAAPGPSTLGRRGAEGRPAPAGPATGS